MTTVKVVNNLKWFQDRIGKRVHTEIDTCKCSTCLEVAEKGLIISDKEHAEYLYDIQNELNINYVSEQRDLIEKEL